MAFSNPINITTASVEQIIERLCWLYSTFRSTFVFDAVGKSYPLSDITQLTRGKIPYPERFNEMIDYQQNAVIQGLQTSDLLCTREDWILRGRLDHTIRDQRDNEGQELFFSMEGVALRKPSVISKKIMHHVKKFPYYLLDPSNTIIGKIVSIAFEGMAPPTRATLSWVHELQRTEVVLQNLLATNRRNVARSLVEAMKHRLKDFNSTPAVEQGS